LLYVPVDFDEGPYERRKINSPAFAPGFLTTHASNVPAGNAPIPLVFLDQWIILHAVGSGCICRSWDCAWLGRGTLHHSASAHRNGVNWLGQCPAHRAYCGIEVRFEWGQIRRMSSSSVMPGVVSVELENIDIKIFL
jgi:hypothetical protein